MPSSPLAVTAVLALPAAASILKAAALITYQPLPYIRIPIAVLIHVLADASAGSLIGQAIGSLSDSRRPVRRDGSAGVVGPVSASTTPVSSSGVQDGGMAVGLLDAVYGSLIGSAMGDALGAPVEGWHVADIRRVYGKVELFLPQPAAVERPEGAAAGEITDDSALRHYLCMAMINKPGRITPDDYARVLLTVMDPARVFVTEQIVLQKLRLGMNPWDTGRGQPTADAAVMAIAPVGLINAGNPDQAYQDGYVLAGVHQEGIEREAAATVAAGIAQAVLPGASVDSVLAVMRSHASEQVRRLIELALDLAHTASDVDVFVDAFYATMLDRTFPIPPGQTWDKDRWNGPTSREVLPAVVGLLRITGQNPTRSLIEAASMGRDCDTIATILGGIVGALHGAGAFDPEWIQQCEAANAGFFGEVGGADNDGADTKGGFHQTAVKMVDALRTEQASARRRSNALAALLQDAASAASTQSVPSELRSPAPFEAMASDDDLEDLVSRLDRTRWPAELPAGWDRGTDPVFLRSVVDYWRHVFDWRAQERVINRYPHYRVELDDTTVHYLHLRGHGPAPMPLILTHGWPSSFLEFLPLIPILTDPAAHGGDPADAFDVVIPSLPGFGYSAGPAGRGVITHTPALWLELMTEVLGYPRFAAHGTDIGAFLTNRLALDHPQAVIGVHVLQLAEPWIATSSPLTEEEQAWCHRRQVTHETSQAYAHLQRTTPTTVGYALEDSPVGLAAWIIEKWQAWSDCGGDPRRRFTHDQLLATITLYWLTRTATTSMHAYADLALASDAIPDREHLYPNAPAGGGANALPPDQRIEVPAALLRTVGYDPPKSWAERAYTDLRHWARAPRGGHFLAMEEPTLLASDLREFFRPLR